MQFKFRLGQKVGFVTRPATKVDKDNFKAGIVVERRIKERKDEVKISYALIDDEGWQYQKDESKLLETK